MIESEKDEVIGMILSEYNEEAFIKTLREDGYDEGLAEGFSLGEQKGLAEGERKKAVETARNLYTNGVSVDIIAKSLGMSQEQVQEIISEKAVV